MKKLLQVNPINENGEGALMEAVFAVWQRDVIKIFRDKGRLLGSFAMPFMFLILFGSGMSGAMKSMLGGNAGSGPLADFDLLHLCFRAL